jgi:hypothetical protein
VWCLVGRHVAGAMSHHSPDSSPQNEGEQNPTAEDFAMAKALDLALPNELATVREQGKNWVGALTALTGLVAIVTVLKGPETTTDLVWWLRLIVAALAVGSLVLLALGVRKAYTAAYGSPGEEIEINRARIDGLYARVIHIRENAADASRAALKEAVTLAMFGLAAIMLATVLTWFPPSGSGTSGAVCIVVNGRQVVKFKTTSLPISTLASGTEVKGC